jgi:hypothetical protein
MGTLHAASEPPPALSVNGGRAPVANAYFAVTIDAAVDLRGAREYRNLPRAERVTRARAEQQAFLSAFLDPGLGAALDLRIAVDPAASTPLSVAVLGRVWGGSAAAAAERAEGLRGRVKAAVPRHVTASAVEDAGTVARLLAPFSGTTVDSAVITRHEQIAVPSRPDAGVSYYYSALPLHWSEDGWQAVYAALAASPVPLVLSVAVLPMLVPAPFAQTLLTLANFYGRLAKEGDPSGGFYHGGQRLPADAFAVDAEKAFQDFSRRLAHKAYALRIQVSAARRLPPGLVETVAAAIAGVGAGHQRPASASSLSRLTGPALAGAGYDIRRPASVAERRLAEYNLNVINFGMLTGQPEIWGRHDPPDPQLAMLTVLGDVRDASCAFRFPVAADGSVPGFTVLTHLADGPTIRLGAVSGSDHDVVLPLRSLAGHTLIAGSAGSGKSTTAAEILRQLWADHQVPFLVIDPARFSGYRWLADEPGFESAEVITVGDESGTPLRFNPFAVPAGVLVGEHAANLLACFTAAFGLSGPLPSVYRDALSLTYLRAGLLTAERPDGSQRTWPTVTDFVAALDEVTADPQYAGDARAIIKPSAVGRARQLVRGVNGSAFLTSLPGGIGPLLGHPVILELGALGSGDEQALMMALLLSAVTEHRGTARGVSSELVHVTLVEQAHRLLARSPDGKAWPEAQSRERAAAALAGELLASRRHGEGVIIAEQFPGALVKGALKETSVKIMHRLTAEDDRRSLGETMPMGQAQRVLAARLRPGEALLYNDEFTEAVHADIKAAASRHPLATAATAKRSASPPFAACDHCRAQCTYRGAALSMLNDPRIVDDVTGAAGQSAVDAGSPGTEGLPASGESKESGETEGLPEIPGTGGLPEIKGTGGFPGTGGLAALRRKLYDTVSRFPALPAADPGRSDAAFCLFLHVHASSELRLRPEWPAVAARLLGITAGPDEAVANREGLQATSEALPANGECAAAANAAAATVSATDETGTRDDM